MNSRATMRTDVDILSGTIALFRANDRVHASGTLHDLAGVTLERSLHPVLFVLSESGPVRVNDIAQILALQQSTASRHVERLVSQGLAQRQQDPVDGRATLVCLSPVGRLVCERFATAWQQLFAEVTKQWSTRRRQQVAVLLHDLAEGLTELCAARGSGRSAGAESLEPADAL